MASHLLTALRWPPGLLMTWWAYTWRITPLHRREEDGAFPEDGAPALPPGTDREDLLLPESGAGAFMRRRYRVDVIEPALSPEELMARLREDPNLVTPWGLAHFHKRSGGDGPMRVGDEYLVRMPGPWDGPVRAVEVTATSFRFSTMAGHLEAGQIEWRAARVEGALRFEVESWSRPADRLSKFAHHHLRAAKEVQLHMWTTVLEKAARLAGGRMPEGVDIHTRVVG